MITLISKEFDINVLEAEKIYLSKFKTIYNMFEESDVNTMTKSRTYLYNKFGKFAVDYNVVKKWKTRIQKESKN